MYSHEPDSHEPNSHEPSDMVHSLHYPVALLCIVRMMILRTFPTPSPSSALRRRSTRLQNLLNDFAEDDRCSLDSKPTLSALLSLLLFLHLSQFPSSPRQPRLHFLLCLPLLEPLAVVLTALQDHNPYQGRCEDGVGRGQFAEGQQRWVRWIGRIRSRRWSQRR